MTEKEIKKVFGGRRHEEFNAREAKHLFNNGVRDNIAELNVTGSKNLNQAPKESDGLKLTGEKKAKGSRDEVKPVFDSKGPGLPDTPAQAVKKVA